MIFPLYGDTVVTLIILYCHQFVVEIDPRGYLRRIDRSNLFVVFQNADSRVRKSIRNRDRFTAIAFTTIVAEKKHEKR